MPIGAALPLIGGLISGGASVAGGIIGSKGAKDAALTQAAAGTQALAFDRAQYAQAQQNASPYLAAGQNALARLYGTPGQPAGYYGGTPGTTDPDVFGGDGRGQAEGDAGYSAGTPGTYQPATASYGGLLNQAMPTYSAGTFSAPDYKTAESDPGYQFALKQGQQLLANQHSRAGDLKSGAYDKALIDYGQGAAATQYGNVFNRALQSYQANTSAGLGAFNANLNSQGQQFGQLYNLANLGYGATSGLNNLSAGYANSYGNTVTGIGNSQAAGQIGSANALAGGLSGVGTAINQGIGTYYGLKKPATYSYVPPGAVGGN